MAAHAPRMQGAAQARETTSEGGGHVPGWVSTSRRAARPRSPPRDSSSVFCAPPHNRGLNIQWALSAASAPQNVAHRLTVQPPETTLR